MRHEDHVRAAVKKARRASHTQQIIDRTHCLYQQNADFFRSQYEEFIQSCVDARVTMLSRMHEHLLKGVINRRHHTITEQSIRDYAHARFDKIIIKIDTISQKAVVGIVGRLIYAVEQYAIHEPQRHELLANMRRPYAYIDTAPTLVNLPVCIHARILRDVGMDFITLAHLCRRGYSVFTNIARLHPSKWRNSLTLRAVNKLSKLQRLPQIPPDLTRMSVFITKFVLGQTTIPDTVTELDVIDDYNPIATLVAQNNRVPPTIPTNVVKLTISQYNNRVYHWDFSEIRELNLIGVMMSSLESARNLTKLTLVYSTIDKPIPATVKHLTLNSCRGCDDNWFGETLHVYDGCIRMYARHVTTGINLELNSVIACIQRGVKLLRSRNVALLFLCNTVRLIMGQKSMIYQNTYDSTAYISPIIVMLHGVPVCDGLAVERVGRDYWDPREEWNRYTLRNIDHV